MGSIAAIPEAVTQTLRSVDRAFKNSVAVMIAGVSWLERQLERRRSRIALMELSDELLKDIGLSRADAHREAARPFWD
jgi:uncharacterized protein YjiS (DUF1127 family)